MNDHDRDHERAIERAIEHLTVAETGRDQVRVGADARERSYTDLLALLPFAEQPLVPDPATKAALLAAVGDGTSVDADRPTSSDRPMPARFEPARTRPPAHGRPAQSTWVLALAAMLGVCLVGLVFLTGRVSDLRAKVGALEATVARAGIEHVEQSEALVTQLRRAQDNLDMITTLARQVYPMRLERAALPDSIGRGSALPRGVVWVCGRHQQWYLTVQGLTPPPPGFAYTLWFTTDTGLVNAGEIEVTGAGLAELGAQFMPVGTHSFQLTLERGGPQARPTGPPFLIADRPLAL